MPRLRKNLVPVSEVKFAARGNSALLRWFSTSIKAKLSLPFIVMLMLIAALGIVSLRQIDTLSAATSEISGSALPKVLVVNEIERAIVTHSLLAKRQIQTNDFRQQAIILKSMIAAEADVARLVTTDAIAFIAPAEAEAFGEMAVGWERYLASLEQVITLNDQGSLRQAQTKFDDETQSEVERTLDALRKLVLLTRDEATDISASVETGAIQAKNLVILVLLAGVGATLVAMRWTEKGVSQPLVKISAAMDQLAHGDDSATLPRLSGRADEIGMLFRAATAFKNSVIVARTLTAEVEDERKRLKATVDNMPIGVCMFDKSNELVVANQAFSDILGLPQELISPRTDKTAILNAIVVNYEQKEGNFDQFLEDSLCHGNPSEGQAVISSIEDNRKISTLFLPTGDGCMMICEDVTRRLETEQRIRHLARHDSLTGLPNRLAFEDEITAALAAATSGCPTAILFIDLDRFKDVNDSLGHPIGDALLKQVAKRLEWAVDEKGAVARFGGDEFAVIQRDQPQPQNAKALGEQIVELLSAPFDLGDATVQIGASIGVAYSSDSVHSPDEMLRNADLALYVAKAQGRGRCQVFNRSMSESQRETHLLEQALRQALRNDELYLHYQPLVDLATGETIGAEALARWNHPTQGSVPPSVFIPMAEELGLISQLGAQVLGMACRDAASWPADLTVSVNLSPLQFHSINLVEDVTDALDRAGLDPRRLILEITEGVLLGSNEHTKRILGAFRQRGIQIALDDFGTGYSSLRYLQFFNFDKVKIDASFIRELPDDEGALAIVRSICAIGATFGFQVTAEGIETLGQATTVRREGAALGQGFYFGAPMSSKAFLDFASSGSNQKKTALLA